MVVSEFAKLFDSNENPVLAVYSGEITYFNPAAKMCLGGLLNMSPQSLFPEASPSIMEFNGVSYNVTSCNAFDHQIYTLFPIATNTVSDDLLYKISGNLKEHIAALKLSCTMMMPGIESLADEKTCEYFRIITKSCAILHRMVGNLGYFQSFDLKAFSPTVFDIAESFRNITLSVPAFIGERCPALYFECAEESIVIQADRKKLELALYQLLSNSIKNTMPSGKITVTLSKSTEMLNISVSDTGCGLSAEQLENIWQPGNSYISPGDGIGAGLPIVQSIARLHGGHALLSGGKSGTTVTVSVPVSQSESDSMSGISAKYDSGLSDLMLQLADVIPTDNFNSKFMD